MSANIENMAYVGEVPWHGLGKKLDCLMTSHTAIIEAGLDWDVETAKIVSDDAKKTGVDNYRITRRVTDNVVLGVVKKKFVPIQNRDAFKMFDHVVGDGKAVYETAGSLQGGSKVFISARLPEVMEIGKGIGPVDECLKYLLLSNAHDGSSPLQMLFTPVRVVCSNTLNLALYEKDKEGELKSKAPRVKISHNENAKKMIKEKERVMAAALKYYEKFGDFANFAYSKQLNKDQVSNIIAEVFPPNKKKQVTPKIQLHRLEVQRLFEEGKGHNKIAGSAWALINGFTEYADHRWAAGKSENLDEQSYSVLLGGAKGLKTRATKAVVEAII